eukprot:2333503-Amphidinium_carterae.1
MAAGLASMSTGSDEVSCLVLGNPFTSLRSEVLFKTKWTMLPWFLAQTCRPGHAELDGGLLMLAPRFAKALLVRR